jgi:methyl-accepting chemotaxis protein
MGGNWTFGRKLGFGFAVALLTLLLVAAAGYRSIQQLVENDRWVSHTTNVREELARFTAALTEAETGQRGFLITGEEPYLEPYFHGIGEIERSYAALRGLTADSQAQQDRLSQMRPILDERLARLKRVIEARRTAGLETAVEAVTSGEGKLLMDQLRALVGTMDRTETELLERRHREAEASADFARTVIVWGSACGLIFVAIVGYLISSSVSLQVGAAVGRIQSSSAELQAAANQQATGAKEQATAMAEITTTINELLATARQIAESARRVSGIAEDATKSADDGQELVGRTQDAITGIQRQVEQIVAHMLELGRKSQQIGGILELINELAEQTNILAINATIEAAGAGEAGRRFSVVGEEIRRLADRVGLSTKEVRRLIDDIQSSVNKTVMATEGGNKAVEMGARQFSEVASAFGSIAQLVSTTTDAAREIELSTKQQSTAVEQVNVAVSNVAQASRETETSSTQTLVTASELVGLSRELTLIVRTEGRSSP